MKFAVFDHLDRSGPDLVRQYEERLRLVEIYEWADFHAYHVAEHHVSEAAFQRFDCHVLLIFIVVRCWARQVLRLEHAARPARCALR